jgi:hypothetical protein
MGAVSDQNDEQFPERDGSDGRKHCECTYATERGLCIFTKMFGESPRNLPGDAECSRTDNPWPLPSVLFHV